jgi:hypothetical protein
MRCDLKSRSLVGDHGSLPLIENDEVALKLSMLIEGECEGLGPTQAAEKYGYSRQRYTQLRLAYLEQGSIALLSQPRGPKRNYRRTDELVRQVIRHRFLDPQATPEVIAQKLRQTQFVISTRSVERVISDFGLQKKDSTRTGHVRTNRRRSKRKSVGNVRKSSRVIP